MTTIKVYDQHDGFYRATIMGQTYEVGNPQHFLTRLQDLFPTLSFELDIISLGQHTSNAQFDAYHAQARKLLL
jgi:hypothetical protein